jgi:glycosyltransferase involved in cell wall biosynthesis
MPFGYQPRFPGAPRLPAPRPGEPLRFAFWGGVGRHKGVDVLVAAFGRLCAAGHAAELHVLGAIETPAFEQQLRALGQGLPVTFHGAFTPAQLRAVAPHCGVFPSTCIETYGIVLDECFELGLPCIVSDLGALPLRSGAAGLVTAAGDATSLATAMQRLCSEPALWPQLAAAMPPPPPSVAAHCDALQSVYERVRLRDDSQFAPPVEALRRVLFLQRQRETALWKALGSRLPE